MGELSVAPKIFGGPHAAIVGSLTVAPAALDHLEPYLILVHIKGV